MEDFNFDVPNKMISRILDEFHNRFQQVLIEGLLKKGISIKDKKDLLDFIEKHCRREVYRNNTEHIYYIDNVPFLKFTHDNYVNMPVFDNGQYRVSANMGTYEFI